MNLLNKKAVILGVTVIIVFLLAIFTAQGKYRFTFSEKVITTILAPVEYTVSYAGYGVRNAASFVGQIMTVYRDNQALKLENDQLRQNSHTVTEIMAENERLRSMLAFRQEHAQFDFVVAGVVGRDPGTWTSTIVINRGTDHGIAKGMPVVTPQGLVGNVTSVYGSSAKVQLILDPRSAVGGLVQRPESRVVGIVEGNINRKTTPHMVNIARDADMIDGDKIITSGFGGIYPKGLVIGEVAKVVNEDGGLLKYAVLKTAVDFNRLEEVLIIVRSRQPVPTLPLDGPLTTANTVAGQPGSAPAGAKQP